MQSAMTVRGLCAAYDKNDVLRDVSFELPAYAVTAVIGPSGCGKSTLLHCLNGMLREQSGARVSGEILLNGQDIAALPAEELRRRVGLVQQTPAPFPFSISRNMTYAPRYHGIRDRARLKAITQEKLEMAGLWGEVGEDLDRNAYALSGGQQQRLCIARALTAEPEVLLLDEPCSALDVKSTAVIEETLVRLKEKYTLVLVTHNLRQARRIADHVLFLHGGRLVESAPAEQFFAEPAEELSRAFLSGAFG